MELEVISTSVLSYKKETLSDGVADNQTKSQRDTGRRSDVTTL